MDVVKKFEMALAYKGISKSELARQLGTSAPNITQKFRRGTFSIADCNKIAEILGAEFDFTIKFPDGTII